MDLTPEMVKLLLELGGLGLAAYMTKELARAVHANTRVLEKIHGFLTAHGMKDSDTIRKETVS
jgi:hypothetical protein